MAVAGEGGFGEGGFGEGGFGEGGEGASSPTVEFARTIGNTGNIEIEDLAAMPSGAFAIAASTYNQDVDFGAPTTPLIHQGESDAIIAEFGSDGSPLRATLSGNEADEVANAVAYDSSGALITAETHSWGAAPGVLLRRTDRFGALDWSKLVQGPATAREVAADAERNVVLTGVFFGPVDFGGGPLPSSGATDTYIVKLDRKGNWVWGREFIGYHSFPTGIATDSEGNVLVVGTFAYNIDFGSGVVTGVGSTDLFIAKFSSTGELLFANTYAGNGAQNVRGVAVLSDDSFVIAGDFYGYLDLGLGAMHGSSAILVSRFSADGTTMWSKAIESSSGEAMAYDIAVDPSDNIVLAGYFQGTLQVPTPLQAEGIDAVVIGLHPNGDFGWAQPLGGPGRQEALTVATDGKGNVLVGGRFFGSIDFGDGPVGATGSLMDLFVAKITL